jgi:hypothetical protein
MKKESEIRMAVRKYLAEIFKELDLKLAPPKTPEQWKKYIDLGLLTESEMVSYERRKRIGRNYRSGPPEAQS